MMILTTLVMFGCAPSIQIQRDFYDPGFSFKQMKSTTKIALFVSENIRLTDYADTYHQVYPSDQFFFLALKKQIADTINAVIGCPVDFTGTSGAAAELHASGIDRSSTASLQQLFSGSSADYFLTVNSVEISRKIILESPMLTSNPNDGGGTMVNSGESENCRVVIGVEVWSVKTRRKVLSYSSTGESPATQLLYGAALKNALAGSVRLMIRYLATGHLS